METAGTCPGASAQKKAQEAWLQPGGASAEEIGKILGIPVVANLVKRVHYTGYQKKLDPRGRKKNLEHAFAPGGDPDRLPTDFRRVIIIDDIYTTGNTVDQVAKVLKTMGFQKVYFLTISIGQGY